MIRSVHFSLPLLPLLLTLAACDPETTTDDAGPDAAVDAAAPDAEPEECERLPLTNSDFAGGLVLEAFTCWSVSEHLSLTDGTVEIEEGVSIHFATDTRLQVGAGGQLQITGTETDPVVLGTHDPLVTWAGIQFSDSQGSNNAWQHVEIENGGSDNWSGAAYSGAAVAVEGSSTLSMDHVTIRNSQSHGLLAGRECSFSFTNGTFDSNETVAYVHPDVASGIAAETEFTDNTNEFVHVVFGNTDTVVTDQTWAALQAPYRVADRFFVSAALTIAAGAVVEMEQDTSLILETEGNLTLVGTAAKPIVLRGSSAGTRGYWKGIEIKAGGTDAPLAYGATFDHVQIEDAGGDNWTGNAESIASVYMGEVGSALFTHSTIRNSGRYALYASKNARIDGFSDNTFTGGERIMLLHPDRVGELAGNSDFSGNDDDRIHVVMGNTDRLTKDATWKNVGVPYEMTDRSFIEASLSLDAGVVLEFGQDVGLIVEPEGDLSAAGTAGEPVTLRGVNPVATGYWAGVRFDSNTAANALSHTVISHAGSDGWTGAAASDAALYLTSGAMLALSDVNLGPGGGHGIFIDSSSSTLSCSNVMFTDLVKGNVYDDDTDAVLPACP